ncbi:hypothetical protein WDW86_22180 [Bdellovibrionota bacterium FG-2]
MTIAQTKLDISFEIRKLRNLRDLRFSLTLTRPGKSSWKSTVFKTVFKTFLALAPLLAQYFAHHHLGA